MRYRVIFQGVLQSTKGSIEEAARLALAEAMAELNRLGHAPGNAAIDLNCATGAITITCGVEAEDPAAAAQAASDNMYLSLNKAGFNTQKWPDVDHSCWSVEFMSTSAEALVAA